MSFKANTVQPFNLKTMSGVFPGTRTKVFQRLQLLQVEGRATGEEPNATVLWSQLLWYDEPPACVLFTSEPENRASAGQATAKKSALKSDRIPVQTALLRIENPQKRAIFTDLAHTLAQMERQPFCCGACEFLEPSAKETQDGFPSGKCTWQPDRPRPDSPTSGSAAPEAPHMGPDPFLIEYQSIWALGCDHWQRRKGALTVEADWGVRLPPTEQQGTNDYETVPSMPKAAERPAKSTPRGQWGDLFSSLWRFINRTGTEASQPAKPPTTQERSGVGAGTEPCFVCQGRLANLNALVVETEEGDKQTFSLWRCRNCYSYFLSDWVDRWERLDNLETEESHYRVAPSEAVLILEQSNQAPGSDHPAGRQHRTAYRRWFEEFVQERSPLSHQIKLGR